MAGCRNEDCFEFIASAGSNLPLILYQLRSNSGGIMADGPSKGALSVALRKLSSRLYIFDEK